MFSSQGSLQEDARAPFNITKCFVNCYVEGLKESQLKITVSVNPFLFEISPTHCGHYTRNINLRI